MVSYFESTLNSAYMGTCPTIACPSVTHHKNKKRKLLTYSKWKDQMPGELGTKFTALASSLLAFLCGGCHSLKTLDLGHEANTSAACYDKLRKNLTDLVGRCRFTELMEVLQAFQYGVSVEETYDTLLKGFFPSMAALSDADAWEVFSDVLRTIPDPERRANLHLRYLRDRPRIKTLCCAREHCFRCKIKDYHEGKTCMESLEGLDHSIVSCPTCGISLAKGDGCNTVTCVCGKQFSWSSEKENSERCVQFLSAFPNQPTVVCVRMLCGAALQADASGSPPALPAQHMALARAWQTRHRADVSRGLKEWFRMSYWPCPSQAVTVLALDTVPDGVREGADLWRTSHLTEVEKCKQSNLTSLRAVFTSLCPVEADRPAFAQRFLLLARRNNNHGALALDSKLIKSVQLWIETHQKEYAAGLEVLEDTSAKQFLFLHGSRSVTSIKPTALSQSASYEWNRTTSNADLTFSADNSTVERVGSVSCYPAAFASLANERAIFRIEIVAAPKTSNWLTFGLARRGMASSSSDGVGRTPQSWGISDDRSSSTSHTLVAASGVEVAQWRKLKVGDILTASVDTVEGWVEISLNDTECVHRFDALPAGTRDDYWFAMTFANDHRVTLLPDGPAAAPVIGGGTLNPEQSAMYGNFKKAIKRLLAEDGSGRESTNLAIVATRPRIVGSSSAWVEMCGGEKEAAMRWDLIRSDVMGLIGAAPRKESKDDEDAQHVAGVTFSMLLDAASWARLHRERLLEDERINAAMLFQALHQDDAPFLAAVACMDYHSHRVTKEDQAAALAYMSVFSEEMQDWYDYDAKAREPVIDGLAKGCRCLPRHLKTCPVLRK